MDLKRTREASIRTANRLGVEVLDWLPLLDAEMKLRSLDAIVARLLAMHAAAATAYRFDRSKVISWLNQESLIEALTGAEKEFVLEGIGDAPQFIAQIEGMWALAWVIGIVDDLDFARDCDDHFVAMLPDLRKNENSAEFRARAVLRPLEQVVAACDLAYCLHWAVQEATLHRRHPPGNLKLHLVIERRRALEWVSCTEEWDEVPLDT